MDLIEEAEKRLQEEFKEKKISILVHLLAKIRNVTCDHERVMAKLKEEVKLVTEAKDDNDLFNIRYIPEVSNTFPRN